MGWERRGNNGYYYRKERSGGRVRSVYVGRGDLASLIALHDVAERQELKAKRIAARQEHTAHLANNIDSLGRLVSTLVEATLIISGFHQHKRQWRKRRV